MYAIDFFCGAGGLTRGFLNAGITVLAGIDNDPSCKTTYESNNKPARFIQADINKLQFGTVKEIIKSIDPNELILAACAPCQPFASLNKYGRNEDAKLLGRFAVFIKEIKPRFIFIENVAGLARVKGFSTFERFKKSLERLDYHFVVDVIDAKSYGVPQTRRRLILIAARGMNPTMPPPTHGLGLLPYVKVENAIKKYPSIKAGEDDPKVYNHKAAAVSKTNMERLQATPHNGGSRTDWPENLWLECHKDGHDGHTDVYGRMRWEQPSPTLTCRCFSLSNGRYGHPEQDRAISFREAAKLQTFGDDYVFYGSSNKILGGQIGNAVPVLVAEVFARNFITLSKKAEDSISTGK